MIKAKKVYSASVTPLLEDGELDVAGLGRIFERNIRHGLDGIFILGSMGEWRHCTASLRAQLIAESVRINAGRVELLVGITAESTPAAIRNMAAAARHDFDSFVYMLPKVCAHTDIVQDIVDVLESSDRPLYYYHCPPANGHELSLDQFEKIMCHPRLKGIKNSSSNMMLRRELILLKRKLQVDAALLEGQEWAVDEALLVGCDGMLCGMGALASRMMVEIARAVDHGDTCLAVRTQNRMIQLFHGVYGRRLETIWTGQKYALKLLGLCSSAYTRAQEMDSLDAKRKSEIEKCIAEFEEELD